MSESEEPGVDAFQLVINVSTLRVSETEHRILYQLLPSGTATVVPFGFFGSLDFDARFGLEADPLQQVDILNPGQDAITPLLTVIQNDFKIEEDECYSIRITPIFVPGLNKVFTCNDDETNPTNYSCVHTICIENDDGKVFFMHTQVNVYCEL